MNFNKILQSLFGNKSTRDMKLIHLIMSISFSSFLNFSFYLKIQII